MFGGVYIGLALPVTAQTQDVWDVVAGGGANAKKGSWGGHCVFVPKYDEQRIHMHHLGRVEDHDAGFLEEVLRRGAHPAGSGLADREGVACRALTRHSQADLQAIK